MKHRLFLCAWLILILSMSPLATTRAQPPSAPARLLVDINPTGDAAPQSFVSLGTTLFFLADDGVHGRELWATDGTAQGTRMVADINPTGDGILTPRPLLPLDGWLYFEGNDGIHGRELWRSDGTAAGTAMVKDIAPGAPSGLIALGVVNGDLLLTADDTIHGAELWRSDGTAAGTTLLKDINPASLSSDPADFTAVHGWTYFSASDGIHGRELWRTDGTTAGTALVIDLRPHSADRLLLTELVRVGERLFFLADAGGSQGLSIWRTDGTAASTQHVAALPQNTAKFQYARLFNRNDQLYYVSNSTTALRCEVHGPAMVRTFRSCPVAATIVAVNGRVFFAASDDPLPNHLWSTDGTELGTHLVWTIDPDGTAGTITALLGSGGWLYLSARDTPTGHELWQSDGTAGGTRLLHDINGGVASSRPENLIASSGQVVFAADDGIHGREVWMVAVVPRWVPQQFLPLLSQGEHE